MEKIKIQLKHPIQANGQEVSVLELRRPKAKDFREIGSFDKPFSALLDFAAVLAEVPPSAIDELDVDDVPTVIEVVSGFLGKFPGTGTTS